MNPTRYERFLGKRSPVSGVFGSVAIAFVLLVLLIVLFLLRSVFGLLGATQLTKSVTTMLDDDSFREKIAETIVELAPDGTLTVRDVEQVMKQEEIAEAVGQLGSDWVSEVLATDADDEIDPVDAAIEVLEKREHKELFEDALDEAMKELELTDDDLYDGAVALSEEMDFEPPARNSDNLEIIIVVLDGSRETVRTEAEEVFTAVEEVRESFGGIIPLLSVFNSLSRTVVFVLFNIVLTLILYGLMALMLKNLWKPGFYLGVPYLLVGILMVFAKFVDFGFVLESYDIPTFAESAVNILQDSVFYTGLIGVVFGIALFVIAITVKIEINSISNQRKETKVCSVPNAEV